MTPGRRPSDRTRRGGTTRSRAPRAAPAPPREAGAAPRLKVLTASPRIGLRRTRTASRGSNGSRITPDPRRRSPSPGRAPGGGLRRASRAPRPRRYGGGRGDPGEAHPEHARRSAQTRGRRLRDPRHGPVMVELEDPAAANSPHPRLGRGDGELPQGSACTRYRTRRAGCWSWTRDAAGTPRRGPACRRPSGIGRGTAREAPCRRSSAGSCRCRRRQAASPSRAKPPAGRNSVPGAFRRRPATVSATFPCPW